MTVTEVLLKNVSSILLGVGFAFSLYHNVKNNKERSETHEQRLNSQEANTVSFLSVMEKMLDILKTKDSDREKTDDSIRLAHKKREDGDASLDSKLSALEGKLHNEIGAILKEYVSHTYCTTAMAVSKKGVTQEV